MPESFPHYFITNYTGEGHPAALLVGTALKQDSIPMNQVPRVKNCTLK